MSLTQHVIGILSVYTALLVRSTKGNRMDICFFDSQVYISCILKNFFLTKHLVRQKIQGVALTLRKTKGFLESLPQILPLSSKGVGVCFSFLLL